ncbi:MAG: MFS transporter [Planctomycetes bacterium]|nr:MFS transporter [Planctomycetota bacterium]
MHRPPPSDVRRGLVASTWEGAFAQAFMVLTGGVFLVDFARRLGADDAALGLLAALPFLAQSAQVGTAWVYERVHAGRATITAVTLVAARLLWLLPAALALASFADGSRLVLYLVVVALSALLTTAGAHGWTSWMTDLVPPRVRGRYFGFRAAVCAFVAIAAGYGGGLLLEAGEAAGAGRGFAAVYVLGALAGVGAWFAMKRQHHPLPHREGPRPPFRALWHETWRKPENRRIFLFFGVWNVAVGMGAPFWQDYMRRELSMAAWEIGLQNNVGAIVGVAFAPWWGRMVDRAGVRPVLFANAACIALIPFLWLLCGPGTVWPVWLDAFVVGIFWTGFNLTALNVPISAAPRRGAAVFLGVFSAVTGLAFGLSCIASGLVAKALGPGPHVVLGGAFAVHQVMFLASGVLRLAAIPFALQLPDPKAKRIVFLFNLMGYAVRHRLNLGRQILTAPWRKRT